MNKVWTLVNLPNRKRAIGTKWVFRNKKDERGSIVRNKAKLVAQGYTQEKGIYYDEVFPPVARIEAIRSSLCDEFEGLMHKRFQMSSMGELTFFLGLQVQQKKDGIFISQDKYVAGILKKFDFATVKTASTPMEPNKALIKDEEADSVDVHLYRSMIGSLMYLTASRPDIMFVVCACARFQVTPKMSHLHAVKRIFRYLKGQPKLGLWYPRDSPFDLEAFSDSDYAGASLDRKSTTGGCQFLGKRLISWQCKKQTIVANSTTKAEYVAAANCCGHKISTTRQKLVLLSQRVSTAGISLELQLLSKFEELFEGETSGHINLVPDETVYKGWEDRMERAATTVSSLKAEQDSGSGPRCQDTILGGVDAQTRTLIITSSIMANLEFCDTHNKVTYLLKPEGSEDFQQIVDFLNTSHIKFALTENLTIYTSLIQQFWQTASTSTLEDGEVEITATIDGQLVTPRQGGNTRRNIMDIITTQWCQQ
ncbi:putative ribonuclease H-like domain-containing protein [Tanacetum coccineum]